MGKEMLVFGEFRSADLLVAGAARARALEAVVLSTSPDVLRRVPHGQSALTNAITRVLPVQGWDSPGHVREAFARAFPGRAAVWYTGLDEPSQTVAALRQQDGLPTSPPEVVGYTLNKASLKHDLFRKGLSRLVALRGREVLEVATGSAPWP